MKKIIFFILVFAFVLRIVGINYGLPMFLVSDEVGITAASLKMLELKTLVPALHPEAFRLLYYPPVLSYIYLIFIIPTLLLKLVFSGGSIEMLKQSIVLEPTIVWLTSRIVTVVFGVLLTYLTYIIGNRLFEKRIGIFSAIFVASSFLSVQLSHFARHWIPAAFFMYLVVALAFLIYFRQDSKAYVWAGIMAGIAFGASYITAIALLVVLLAHFLGGEDGFAKKFLDKKFWLTLGVFAVIAAIFTWLNYPEFQRIVFGEDSTLSAPKTLWGMFSAIGESLLAFFHYEPILLVCGLLGLCILFFTQRKLFVIFVSFPVAYWIVLYFFFHFEPRYNTLLVPWFAVLAGLATLQIWQLSQLDQRVRVAGIGILLILPVIISVYYDVLLIRDDSREQAVDWIETNLPSGTSIALFARSLELTPNTAAVDNLFINFPQNLRTKHSVLKSLPAESYPEPAYNLFNFDSVDEGSEQPAPQITAFDFLVIEYYDETTLPGNIKSVRQNARLVQGFNSEARNQLDLNGNFYESVFNIFKMQRNGPRVEIYDL